MIKIIKINICRFRSIIDLTVDIEQEYGLISICGKNNVGKTNTLRALSLFFNENDYEPSSDMPVLKNATGGAATHPKITVDFYDDKNAIFYSIEKNWKNWNAGEVVLDGKMGISLKKMTKMNKKDVNIFLKNIQFYYLEAANLDIPKVIDDISEDILTLEYKKSRFSNTKKQLKEAYESYVDGLQGILDEFAEDISETFYSFKDDWKVKFIVPKRTDSFREMISDDVELALDDQGTIGIEDKGSGLQRLASILLQFETAERVRKNKSIIFCVDEPDIFLHEGLQKKLKKFFMDKSQNMQIFYTTHSRIFIDAYSMKNVIFLDADWHQQYSVRKKRNVNVVETKSLNINNEYGYQTICDHLGIERLEHNILSDYNLVVEGNCDKKYIEGLCAYFKVNIPNIVSANGASNILKYLEFYESYYKNSNQKIPQIVILYDNDGAGRNAYSTNSKKKFSHIDVKHMLIHNVWGNDIANSNNVNHEIEDFLYPEIMCYLVNEIMQKKSMNKIDSKELIKQLNTPAFNSSGIMSLLEYHKNKENPERGGEISFVSSGNATNQIKESLAGLFEIEGNAKIINILEKCNEKYPYVKEFIERIANGEN